MRKYITYKRVSGGENQKSGLGLDAQERDIQLFLENFSETPYEVLEEFVEVQTGADNERPQLRAAIALAKQHQATLVVSKLDRLSRRVSHLSALMEERGLTFKVAQMPYADAFQLHIYAALAEQERQFISQRTKAALKEAKARGVRLGAPVHHIEDLAAARTKKALQDAKKVAGVIVPLRESGKSIRSICEVLNASGIKTSRGASFNERLVGRMLKRLEVAA